MSLNYSITHSPGRVLLLSIIGIIIIGTFLLALPSAQSVPHDLIDLFFTTTSATCVTGLLTIPLTEFTLFGKAIILGLIQIGGLGLITMTVFLISLFFQVGIKTHLMAGHLLELDNWKNSKRIITFITILTFSVELFGACLFYYIIPPEATNDPLWFTALFHSISSFCSAGFSIFPQGMSIFFNNSPFLITTILLIFIGELGFVTWHELTEMAHASWERRWFKLSLHSKIVLSYSSMLTLVTVIFISLLEGSTALGSDSYYYSFLNTFFNALSFKSCGFTTVSIAAFQCASFIVIMVITFIGSSPGSTGSGIKVTSLALLVATVHSVLTGRSVVESYGRRIPHEQIFKAFAIVILALSWVVLTTFLLLLTEHHPQCLFLPLLFESVAAFANLGISLDITPLLSNAGKIIIMFSMLIGRVGALTLILAIKRHRETTEFQYPEERVMLS